ncbi:MAG: hypothetical protein AAF438_06970 [Pseudomonadota bacterium]
MLTIFTIPKGFDGGHTEVIQRNAVASWTKLNPGCEIVLCGDDPGVEQVAKEYGVRWIGDIQRNEFGTPILQSAFSKVAESSRFQTLCYVNADIVLFDDLLSSIKDVDFNKAVIAGQRWDVDITELWDFSDSDYEQNLRKTIADIGVLHPPLGSDYFIFDKNSKVLDIPPFGVGRPGWDCWFIYRVRQLGMRMVDGTPSITLIHQNHDYSHLKSKSGQTADGRKWAGPEVARNRDIIGGKERYFNLRDCTHELIDGRVKLALDYRHIRSRWYRLPVLNPMTRPLFNALDFILSLPLLNRIKSVFRSQES